MDYYKILQVDPSAEPEIIEAAFRRLARKYHPDVYAGDDAHRKMQLINEAYAILKDPSKRRAYDYDREQAAGAFDSDEEFSGKSDDDHAAQPPEPEGDTFAGDAEVPVGPARPKRWLVGLIAFALLSSVLAITVYRVGTGSPPSVAEQRIDAGDTETVPKGHEGLTVTIEDSEQEGLADIALTIPAGMEVWLLSTGIYETLDQADASLDYYVDRTKVDHEFLAFSAMTDIWHGLQPGYYIAVLAVFTDESAAIRTQEHLEIEHGIRCSVYHAIAGRLPEMN